MKVAQTTALKSVSTAMLKPGSGGMPSTLPAGRKAAVVGSGGIITPALAAHARKQMAGKNRQSSEE